MTIVDSRAGEAGECADAPIATRPYAHLGQEGHDYVDHVSNRCESVLQNERRTCVRVLRCGAHGNGAAE